MKLIRMVAMGAVLLLLVFFGFMYLKECNEGKSEEVFFEKAQIIQYREAEQILCFSWQGQQYEYSAAGITENIENRTADIATRDNHVVKLSIYKENDVVIRVLITNAEAATYFHEEISFSAPQAFTVTSGNGKTVVESGGDFNISAAMLAVGESLSMNFSDNDSPTNATFSVKTAAYTRDYEGSFTIERKEEGLLVVNYLPLERYLLYVVPSEMPASYPAEALKAQAVAARTYALYQISEEKYAAYHADVTDDTSCQVYNAQGTNETCAQAVADTYGEVLLYENKPVQCSFFSTSCGVTTDGNIWQMELPYLAGGAVYRTDVQAETDLKEQLKDEKKFREFIDQNTSGIEVTEPWYRWQVTFPLNELQARVSEDIGEITSIEVTERGSYGVVNQIAIYGTKGQKVINNQYQIREFFALDGNACIRNDGSEVKREMLLPSGFFYIMRPDVQAEGAALILKGGGYGHGSGMSQNGAKAYAASGYNYQQILHLFYKNVSLKKWR